LYLAEHFSWKCISVGDLLRKEVAKKTPTGRDITEQQKQYNYIDDSIIIDLVTREI